MDQEKSDKGFKFAVLTLLVFITFFLGGIWCALAGPCVFAKSNFCPIKKFDKMCPITQQMKEQTKTPAN